MKIDQEKQRINLLCSDVHIDLDMCVCVCLGFMLQKSP